MPKPMRPYSRVKKIIEAQDALTGAALVWWRGMRPWDWTPEQHLENPSINTAGGLEATLALACANYVKTQQETNHDAD